MSTPLLEVHDVHAGYLQKEILRGLSMIVGSGEIIAILGENGAGKSTILKVIGGILASSHGSIYLNELKLNGLGPAERHRLGIGYLLQGGRVFPNLTVRENFELAASARRNSRRPIGNLGDSFPALRERCNQRAGLLSGGQRQMLAIEMVLVQKPKLLLLDEPTAALSTDLANTVLRSIGNFVRATGASAVLVEQNIVAGSSIWTRALHLTSGTFTN